MGQIVTTGQITIIDTNDAKPITAYLAGSKALQQAYAQSDATPYNPDWTTGGYQVLTAYVYAGTTANIAATLQNVKWTRDVPWKSDVLTPPILNTSNFAVDGSVASGTVYSVTASTLTIKVNMPSDVPVTYFLSGDYYDVGTGITTHVIASITLGRVTLGSNAVYVQVSGNTLLKRSSSSVKAVTAVRATLYRSSGADITGVTYRWYVTPFDAQDQIDVNYATGIANPAGGNYTAAQLFGFKTTAGENMPSTPVSADLGQGLPADGAPTAHNTLVIHEDAVSGIQFFKVEAVDSSPASATIFTGFFAVQDTSDPYNLHIISTGGDKLMNGTGNTWLYPELYYGANNLTDTTGWKFHWQMYDKTGNLAGFVNETKSGTGKAITSSTAVSGSDFTVTVSGFVADGTTNKVLANSAVKITKTDGTSMYFKVKADVTSGSVITLTHETTWPVTGTQLDGTTCTLNKFAGASLFFCDGLFTSDMEVIMNGGAGTTTAGGFTVNYGWIKVTGIDVDGKSRITCRAEKP